MPDNCHVQGANPRSVEVAPGSTSEVTLAVVCTTGALVVSVTTDGDPDPATSYSVVAGGFSRGIAPNGSITFDDLPEGLLSVLLAGLPEHCTVQGLNPRGVVVPGDVSFEVVCQAPAVCTAAPPVEFIERTSHHPGQGGSWSATVVSGLWNFMRAEASSTAPVQDGTGFIGPGVTVSLGGKDFLQLIPVDPQRMDESVMLFVDVSGEIEVGGSGKNVEVNSIVRFDGAVNSLFMQARYYTHPDDPVGSPGTIRESAIVGIPLRLGQWAELVSAVHVNVGPGMDGSTSMSKAELRVNRLVEVRDGNNLNVPIASVCAASGTVY
jgi:hypothetical protein